MQRPTFLLLLFATLFGAPVMAQDMRTEYVSFAPGAGGTTIAGRITGNESVLYVVGVERGQRLKVRLEPSNPASYFNVYAPGSGPGDQALANGQFTGDQVPAINIFDAEVETSGEYTVSVYMMRSAARRNEVSDYALFLSIEGDAPETVQGDFADGLQGGPDYYQVRTPGGGPLNLREDPSTGGAILTRLQNGQQLRNLGCRMSEARRWCAVETLGNTPQRGWAAGQYLIEGSGP